MRMNRAARTASGSRDAVQRLPTAAGAEPSTTEESSPSTGSNLSSSTGLNSTSLAHLTSFVAPTPSSTTLCFNPSLETDLPCSSSHTTSKPSSSSSDNGFSPPGAKTINSQASHTQDTNFYTWYLFGTAVVVAFIFLRAVGEAVGGMNGCEERLNKGRIETKRFEIMERRIKERMEGGRDEVEVKGMGKLQGVDIEWV
ncbi:MAG: hypothetical protein M1812_003296 [Candelaria pacifica]|nr:MAG: hypothetical protein M1812_003296 [Candelaria pacifica]